MNYNLGRVLPIFKGEYDNDEIYTNLDVVYYNGSSYVAKEETQGNLPTDTEYWQPIAMAGVLDPEQIADIEQQVIEYVQGQGYVIDPNYTHTDNNYTNADKTKLDGIDMSTKQDTLVSGTNIKTINNQSILGSGNISISGGSGGTSDYTQLTNKPSVNGVELSGNKTTSQLGINIPTRTSDLTNDSGFITTETEPAFNASPAKNITSGDITNWNDKLDKINTPSKVYGTSNTGGQLTYQLASSATASSIPYRGIGGVLAIGTPTADAHATTKKYVDDNLATKQDTLVSGTNIKTINNQSILGSGDISISGGGTSDYEQLTSKPSINGIELNGNKTTSQLGINIPTRTSDLTNDSGFITSESEPAFNSSVAKDITTNDISNWNNKQDTLVSGSNIKTVNNQSILGSGNINIDAINPFKGYYTSVSAAPTTGMTTGDYIFVADASPATTVSIYDWDNTNNQWTDSGKDIDPAALAEFQSGERVSATIIDNTSLETPATNSIPRATDVKAQLDKIKPTSTSDCDLKFCDENDYAIVKFQDGHIKTKNFDSSQITSYTKLTGKTYSILGDSISTFHGTEPSYTVSNYDGSTYAYFYPHSTLDNVNKTWFRKMEAITGLEMLNNASWSGSEMCGDSQSTTSAEAGCSTRRITDLSLGQTNPPDIIIVYIGINDMNTYTLGDWTADETIPAEGTIIQFADAYALGLYKVMNTYPNAEVYCCSLLECATVDAQSNPKTFPCINSHGESLRDYNKAIEEISKGIGANFIDLHACGITYWNRATYLFDNTHPNENGTTLIAEYISSQILAQTKLKY